MSQKITSYDCIPVPRKSCDQIKSCLFVSILFIFWITRPFYSLTIPMENGLNEQREKSKICTIFEKSLLLWGSRKRLMINLISLFLWFLSIESSLRSVKKIVFFVNECGTNKLKCHCCQFQIKHWESSKNSYILNLNSSFEHFLQIMLQFWKTRTWKLYPFDQFW
jgi:hypothetical protein